MLSVSNFTLISVQRNAGRPFFAFFSSHSGVQRKDMLSRTLEDEPGPNGVPSVNCILRGAFPFSAASGEDDEFEAAAPKLTSAPPPALPPPPLTTNGQTGLISLCISHGSEQSIGPDATRSPHRKQVTTSAPDPEIEPDAKNPERAKASKLIGVPVQRAKELRRLCGDRMSPSCCCCCWCCCAW